MRRTSVSPTSWNCASIVRDRTRLSAHAPPGACGSYNETFGIIGSFRFPRDIRVHGRPWHAICYIVGCHGHRRVWPYLGVSETPYVSRSRQHPIRGDKQSRTNSAGT